MSDQNISVSIQLLTGEEVARILKISRAYAYRLMKQGDIPTIKIGRTVRVSYDNLWLCCMNMGSGHTTPSPSDIFS